MEFSGNIERRLHAAFKRKYDSKILETQKNRLTSSIGKDFFF